MKGHLMRERDMMDSCLYCSKSLHDQPWESEFCKGIHYKVHVCECGKSNRIKTSFISSGHDSWSNSDKKALKHHGTLEKKVENVRHIEKVKIIPRY